MAFRGTPSQPARPRLARAQRGCRRRPDAYRQEPARTGPPPRSPSGSRGGVRASEPTSPTRRRGRRARSGPRRRAPRRATPRARRGERCGRRRRSPGRSDPSWRPKADPAERSESSQSPNWKVSGSRPSGPHRARRDSIQRSHARVLVANDGDIAIRLVDGPRHDGGRVRPPRSPEPRLAVQHDVRDHGRHPQHRVLIEREIAQPACPERLGFEQRAGGRREGLGIPVQPRRSSRCGQSVGTETKLSRCDQTTFSWNRFRSASERLERAPARGRAADRHVRCFDHVRVGFDLGVSEAVEREHRLEDDSPVIGEDVGIGRSCRSEGAGVQGSVRLQDLGVSHRDPLVAPAPDAEPHVARHVLTAVGPKQPRSCLDRRHGDRGDDADRRRDAGLEDPVFERHLHRPGPGRVIESRRLPAVLLALGDRSPTRRRSRRPGSRRSMLATGRPS